MARVFPGSLSGRITVGFMVLVLAFAGISISTILHIDRLNTAIRITHAGYLQLALVSGDLDSKQATLRAFLHEELGEETSETRARKRLRYLLAAREKLLSRAETILEESQEIEGVTAEQFAQPRSLVEGMRKLVAKSEPAYEALLASPPIALPKGVAPSAEQKEILDVQRRQLRTDLQIGQMAHDFKVREARAVLELSNRLDRFLSDTWLLTLVFGVGAVLLGVLMTIGATVMLRPLQQLHKAAQQIAEGDYAQRIEVTGPREIADLASEFNAMGQAIQERSKELVRTERLATAGKMAAMITHEVRNPLSSIGLNTELLEEEFAALPEERAEEARNLCRAITHEIDRLTGITEEYLQLARPPQPKRRAESLVSLVESVAELVRESFHQSQVELEVVLPEARREAQLDAAQIRQALINLLRNAREAVEGREGAKVSIEVRHEKTHTELRVEDNGPGIPDDILDHVFEAFVSDKQGGTGLGLALTRQIMGDHGAHLSAGNRSEGGASFVARFPHSIQT